MRQLSMGALAAALMLAGCVQQPPPNRVSYPQQGNIVPPAPQYAYGPSQPPAYQNDAGYAAYDDVPQDPSAGIYIDPPLDQPPPVRVEWAPPPLLVETPPPPPYPDAIWTGGYWVWQDNWVWARGRWLAPPRPGYRWMRPYYEHRGDSVIFINGFWAAPGVTFRRPPPTLNIPFARVRPGVARGPRPSGPDGPFLPPPHGARRGTFVPASVPEPQVARPTDRRPQQPDRPDRPFPDRRPDGDQNRDQNRGPDRGPDRGRDDGQRPSPQAVIRPPPSQPQVQPQVQPQIAPPRSDRPNRADRPDRPERQHQDWNGGGNPAEHAQQPQRPPRPQPQAQQPQAQQPQVRQPQAMPRPQAQPVPHAPAPAARPAPQPRPEHRAPPPSRERSADQPAPEQHEGGDRGRRDRDR